MTKKPHNNSYKQQLHDNKSPEWLREVSSYPSRDAPTGLEVNFVDENALRTNLHGKLSLGDGCYWRSKSG